MGYISFKKSGGEVDLLPADNVVHVGLATGSIGEAGQIVITYGTHMSNANLLQATVNFANFTNDAERRLVNSAIELANGISGPAIPVDLPSLVTSVTLAPGTVSPPGDGNA